MNTRTTLPTHLLAMILMLGAACTTAPGQGLPMLPNPVTSDDLMNYADRLDLSNQQRLAMLPMHDEYLIRFSRLRGGDIQDFEDALMDLASSISIADLRIPERVVLEGLLHQFNGILTKVQQVDRTLFIELETILTPTQILTLPSVRYARERSMYQMITLDIAGDFNDGARVNLCDYLDNLELTSEVRQQIDPILRSYEIEMLAKVKKLHGEVEKGFILILDTIDELGLRTMSMEEIGELGEDEDFIQRAMNIFDEASRPFQKAVSKVSELNLNTWRRISRLLPEKLAREVRLKYFRRAYRRSVQGSEALEDFYRLALSFSSLSDHQRTQIELDLDTHRQRDGKQSEEIASLLEKSRKYRTISQMEDDGIGQYDENIDDLVDRREQMIQSARARVEGILGADLASRLALKEEGEEPEEITSQRVIVDGDGNSHVIQIETIVSVEPENERDPYLPSPIGAGRIDEYASRLDIAPSQKSILQSLYDDYRTSYDQLFFEPDTDDASSNDQEPLNAFRKRLDRAKQRESQYDAIRLLDEDFFDQVSLLASNDNSESRLSDLRHSRRLESARQGLSGWIDRHSEHEEAMIDVVALLRNLELPPAQEKRLAESIGAHEADLLSIYEESIPLVLEHVRLESLGRALDEEGSETPKVLDNRLEQRYTTISQNARRLVDLNRNAFEQFKQQLDEIERWQLVQAYNLRVHPEIYWDDDSALGMIDSALALPDLNGDQHDDLSQIANDYRHAYYGLSDQLVDIAKQREGFEFRGVIPVDMIRRELHGERLKFERSETSARVRARLRILLNDEQSRQVRALMEEDEDDESS